MFVRDFISSCRRLWYVVLVGLAITAVATITVFGAIKPTYEAGASVVLIPPKVAVTVGDNPYLYLGGLDQAVGVLRVKVTSPEVAGALLDRYPGSALSIVQDTTTSGPIMAITATADDAGSAMQLLAGTVALMPKTLAELQTSLKVPAASTITMMELSRDSTAKSVDKQQLQATVLTAVVGTAATILITGLLDRMLARRRSGGAAEPEAEPGDRGEAEDPARADEADSGATDDRDDATAAPRATEFYEPEAVEQGRARVEV
ncbi:hypothetical protein BKD30_10845 [Tersicoccus phoenicis]|uniref:Polysaccharide chain length determinant N-terminal domain-containing protein n=1 Tax=Tersicoccus phoenicis TaxID=554083 RepID=A0A1R1L8I4_9MICC|nr:hypothetical protein [Tersicoccus phoenicis]OMH23860.1 hypothetical protein BKD30_10845 [Tersicoccus phoenicis]